MRGWPLTADSGMYQQGSSLTSKSRKKGLVHSNQSSFNFKGRQVMPLFLETFLQLFSRKHCCSTKKCGSQTQAGDCIWIFTNSLNMIHVKQMHNPAIKKSEKCHLASLNDSSTSWSQPLPGCLQTWAWHSGRPLPGPTSQPHYLQQSFSTMRLLTLWGRKLFVGDPPVH